MDRNTRILLGLGANLGRPVEQLAEALARLRRLLDVERVSSVYRTEPVGKVDQPDFYNLVCSARTAREPLELMELTRALERALGRKRGPRNAPRTIDIDLLAYGDRVVQTPRLTLPHPRLHQRAFVLVPLEEIAPEWRHPVFGRTAAELRAEAGPLERVERWGELPG